LVLTTVSIIVNIACRQALLAVRHDAKGKLKGDTRRNDFFLGVFSFLFIKYLKHILILLPTYKRSYEYYIILNKISISFTLPFQIIILRAEF
jgi:hypothetical protein